jgi:uncharacterized protein YdaU (DUF1376 family)
VPDRAPAFQFYPKDFLTDEKVVRMSNTEVGIYTRLLCYCWLEGSLPLETDALAHMARMQGKQFTKLWENSPLRTCFHVGDDGRLHHKRLDEERDKQDHYRRRASDGGKAALGRRGTGGRFTSTRVAGASTPTQAGKPSPAITSTPISNLLSPVSRSSPSERGNQPPLHIPGLSGRFKVWRWMLEEWIGRLGDRAETFDIEAWLLELDARDKLLIPVNTNWKWLDAQWWDEATKRGLVAQAAVVGGEDAMWAAAIRKGPSVRP